MKQLSPQTQMCFLFIYYCSNMTYFFICLLQLLVFHRYRTVQICLDYFEPFFSNDAIVAFCFFNYVSKDCNLYFIPRPPLCHVHLTYIVPLTWRRSHGTPLYSMKFSDACANFYCVSVRCSWKVFQVFSMVGHLFHFS